MADIRDGSPDSRTLGVIAGTALRSRGGGRGASAARSERRGTPAVPAAFMEAAFAARIVTALPAPALALLRAHVPRVELVPLAEHRVEEPALACLVDPAVLAAQAPDGAWAGAIAGELPLIVWASLSKQGMEGVLAAAPLRPLRVLINGVDDVAGMLPRLLASIPRLAHQHRLEEALGPRLARVPTTIRAACARAIAKPESFFDATDLARAAHMSRRHLDRLLMTCGFAPGKAIVVGARVWRAYHVVVSEGRSVPFAAGALGYADAKALVRHVRAVTGEGVAGFRALPAAACIDRVIRHLGPA